MTNLFALCKTYATRILILGNMATYKFSYMYASQYRNLLLFCSSTDAGILHFVIDLGLQGITPVYVSNSAAGL